MAGHGFAETAPNFQTVKLKRGRHMSPEQGVCVMELASMLAGEHFTDHPRSVSPLIAAFLRTYNDLVDDTRRQDLYRYAAASVGTRSSRSAEALRASRLPSEHGWLGARMAGRLRLPAQQRIARATHAARELAARPAHHRAALALVDQLIAVGGTGHSTPAVEVPHASPGVGEARERTLA